MKPGEHFLKYDFVIQSCICGTRLQSPEITRGKIVMVVPSMMLKELFKLKFQNHRGLAHSPSCIFSILYSGAKYITSNKNNFKNPFSMFLWNLISSALTTSFPNEPQHGRSTFVRFPLRGNGFINGTRLNQVDNLLTLVQSFLLRRFLRLVLNSDP